jgi:MoaA/NifB/PqqE/SkfB family radical SAM enzyme
MSADKISHPPGSPKNPIIVYSEVTANCTHKCFFCGQLWVNRHGYIRDDVNDRVVELIKSYPDKHFLVYNHLIGEPLLYKNLENRIRTILLPNTDVWVCTNGVLLDEARIESLLGAGLQNIWFTLFGANRQDYQKFAGVDLYDKARRNLDKLINQLHRFRRARIVCFSEGAADVQARVKDMKNVELEVSRNIEPWDKDQPSKIRFLCVSVNGEITFDWKDSNFTVSPGNILSMTNDAVMNAYYKSWPDEVSVS